MIAHLVLLGCLLLVGGCAYWLAETRLAKIFLQKDNQEMRWPERLVYRAIVPTSVVTFLIAVAFCATSMLLQALGWSWMANLLATNILPTAVAFFGTALLRFGIYRGQERGKIKEKLALVLHVGTLLGYVGATAFIPSGEIQHTIVSLLALHFFGDFTFQSEGMAGDKRTAWDASLVHAGAYTSTFILADGMGLIHLPWWAFWFIFLTHTLIDPLKARWKVIKQIWMDQCSHLVVLLLVAYAPVLWWLVALAVLATVFIWSWKTHEQAIKAEIAYQLAASEHLVFLNGDPIVFRSDGGIEIGKRVIWRAADAECLDDGTRVRVRRGVGGNVVIFIQTPLS